MRSVLLALAIAAVAGPAMAADHMFSFDPDSPDARRLTGAGVTVIFKSRLAGQTVTRILATAVPATADLKPASAKVLAGLKPQDLGKLYAIDPKSGQGAAYVRAFCPGSKAAWLEFSRISRYPLTIRAFGDDPKTPGAVRQCAAMGFTFRGEWALPGRGPPDPMEETRDLEPF